MTLTFFFSDVEDSSGLPGGSAAGYAAVLDEARELQRRAVERAGGREVDCRGDELFCVFDVRGGGARRGARRSSARFAAHAWPAASACACGSASTAARPRHAGDGYVGIDVHRASRICQAGHGGQVLASEEAAAGARDGGDGARRRSSSRGCASRSGSSSSLADDLAEDFPPLRNVREHEREPRCAR